MRKVTDYRTRDYKSQKPKASSKVVEAQRKKIFLSDMPEEKKEILIGKRAYRRMKIDAEKRQCITERAYRYEHLMKKYLCNFTRDFNLIEDAVQDVYLRLMKEPSTLTIRCVNDDERFKRLCFTKAKQSFVNLKNQMDHCRKERLAEPVPGIEKNAYTVFDLRAGQMTTPQEQMDYEWLLSELEATIATMPKDVQAALRLYYAGAEKREVCYELKMNQNVYKSIREEYVPKVAHLMGQKLGRSTKSNEIRMKH